MRRELYRAMFLTALAFALLPALCFGQYGSQTGSYGSVGPANGLVPPTPSTGGGSTYFVATNGNDSSAKVNDASHPWSGVFSTNSGVLSLATNWGDIITVLPGNYVTTNIVLKSGVTFQGVGNPVFSQNTNWINGTTYSLISAVANSLFQPIGYNVTIRGITFVGTNLWTRATDSGLYSSFCFSSPFSFTNLLIENCQAYGGSDIFWGNNPGITDYATVRNCYLESTWDLESIQQHGTIISEGNVWRGLSSLSMSHLDGAMTTIDTGSIFIWNNNAGGGFLSTNFCPNGTKFALTNTSGQIFQGNAIVPNFNGNYSVMSQTNQTLVISGTMNPIREGFVTNGFTTNIVYNLDTNTIIVRAATIDAAHVNGTYKIVGSLTNPPIGNDSFHVPSATWTNTSSAYLFTLNDPANPAYDSGNTSVVGIITNASGTYSDYLDQLNFTTTLAGVGTNVIAGGSGIADFGFATNSITTNVIPTLFPSAFSLQISVQSNAFLWWPSNTATVSSAGVALGIYFVTNSVAPNGSLGMFDNRLYMRSNNAWSKIAIGP